MPDIDGYELIRQVRRLHVGVPAIAVSAYARSEDRNKALASGYNEYCAKPIEGPQLLQTIRQIMTVS